MSILDFGSSAPCFDLCFDARPRPCLRCKHPCDKSCRHYPKVVAALEELNEFQRSLEERKKELT